MKNISRHTIFLAMGLFALSAVFYFIDYKVVGSARAVAVSLLESVAFLFVYILVVAIIFDNLIKNNEKQNKLEKLNMVIGVFYNEVGTELLSRLAKLDAKRDEPRPELMVSGKWTDRDFADAGKKLLNAKYELTVGTSDFEEICVFIAQKRDFLLRLLENPILLEHEAFTELLLAVFHMADEFANREDFKTLPENDLKHLRGDIIRVYDFAVREWLVYMKYLKNNYPYLFSLAVRKNPFDKNASVVIPD